MLRWARPSTTEAGAGHERRRVRACDVDDRVSRRAARRRCLHGADVERPHDAVGERSSTYPTTPSARSSLRQAGGSRVGEQGQSPAAAERLLGLALRRASADATWRWPRRGPVRPHDPTSSGSRLGSTFGQRMSVTRTGDRRRRPDRGARRRGRGRRRRRSTMPTRRCSGRCRARRAPPRRRAPSRDRPPELRRQRP